MNILLPIITALLYRAGGWFWKPARRYLLPLALYFYRPDPMNIIPMVVLSIVFHFNLDEIEEKDWDDVFCYGLAQAWCLAWVNPIVSGLVALSWLLVVLASNKLPERMKLPWAWCELIQGLVIGLVFVL